MQFQPFAQNVENQEPDCNSPACIDCTNSESKLCQLQKDFQVLKIEDDLQIQKLKMQIQSLQKSNEEKATALALNQKALAREQAKNLELEAQVSDRKKKHIEQHFSGDETEYNKVRFSCVYSFRFSFVFSGSKPALGSKNILPHMIFIVINLLVFAHTPTEPVVAKLWFGIKRRSIKANFNSFSFSGFVSEC